MVSQTVGFKAWINQLDAKWSRSSFGSFLGVNQTHRDTVDFLRDRTPGKGRRAAWFQQLLEFLPQGVQTRLARVMSAFNKLPGMSKLSGAMRGGYMVEAFLFRGTNILADTVRGAEQTSGNLLDKLVGGIQGGFRSFMKNAGGFAASVAGGLLAPALLGVSLTGAMGILAGSVGSLVLGGLADQYLGKRMGSQAQDDKAGGKQQTIAGIPVDPQNPIVQSIDKSWVSKDFNEHLKQTNPWLESLYSPEFHQMP